MRCDISLGRFKADFDYYPRHVFLFRLRDINVFVVKFESRWKSLLVTPFHWICYLTSVLLLWSNELSVDSLTTAVITFLRFLGHSVEKKNGEIIKPFQVMT